jgi:CheY-like chemotaxis protein
LVRLRVVVIDDDYTGGLELQRVLVAKGCDVALAPSIDEAIRVLTLLEPDLVLVAAPVATADASSIVRRIRSAQIKLAYAYLVCMSGSSSELEWKARRSAGFDAYCSKPLAHGELGKVLDEARANQRW